MNIKYRSVCIVFIVLIGSVIYAQQQFVTQQFVTQQVVTQQFVTPKKKRPSQKMLKEDIAAQWEKFLFVSADHVALCGQMQKRLLTKREAVEQFVGKADGAALQDHRSRLENLNNQMASLQTTMLKEFKQLEADVEKFCIT